MADVAQLFQGWQGGNAADGDALLRELFPSLFRFFRGKASGDIDDLIQRTLLDCLESRDTVRDAGAFRAFVFSVARHRLFDRLRSELKCDANVKLSDLSLQQLGATPSSLLAREERQQLVDAALRRIPLDHQIALELSYWEGMKAPQIAVVLGLKATTVRARITRARAALQQELKAMGVDDVGMDLVPR
ncbi:MAG: sigma-70 family RNA polymerase sigma factor [Nannocystaceae bacterium]|nr:sigma-70 family RNA polymerase sigma factor [Nannocystaceae bacterium]